MGVVCASSSSLLHFRFLWKEEPRKISDKDIDVTEKENIQKNCDEYLKVTI